MPYEILEDDGDGGLQLTSRGLYGVMAVGGILALGPIAGLFFGGGAVTTGGAAVTVELSAEEEAALITARIFTIGANGTATMTAEELAAIVDAYGSLDAAILAGALGGIRQGSGGVGSFVPPNLFGSF